MSVNELDETARAGTGNTLQVEEPQEPAATARTKPHLFASLAALYVRASHNTLLYLSTNASLHLQLVLFIAALDQTIVATAIPTISASLHSGAGYTWIGSAYVLSGAAAGPIWAKCSDIWGRKGAVLCAVTLFAGSSVAAASSKSMAVLVAARALQGIAGGGMSQLVAITVSDLFSMRARALYIGLMGFMWAVAGSAGPLLGGALAQLASWRWIWWINLPVCAVTLAVLFLFLDVHNPRTRLREGVLALDWYGTASMLAVTVLILLGLDFGGAIFPWNSPKVICLLVFGVSAVGLFMFCEMRLAKYPIMPMGIFASLSNSAIFVVAVMHSMVSVGVEFYLPLYLQAVQGASPLRSGVLILPLMTTASTVNVLSGILIHQTGRYRELIWVGVTFMTIGTGLFIHLGRTSGLAQIVAFQIVHMLGVSLMFNTPMIAIQNTVSQAEMATATATLSFVRNMATALSIVLGGTVFQNGMASQKNKLLAAGLSMETVEALSGDKAAANLDIVTRISDARQRHAVQDSFAWSLRNMFIMYTCLAAVALLASPLIKHRNLRTEHTETKTGIQNMVKRQQAGR